MLIAGIHICAVEPGGGGIGRLLAIKWLAHQIVVFDIGGLAHESAVNMGHPIASADRESQDKNFVGPAATSICQNGRLARFGRFDFYPCIPLYIHVLYLRW